MADDTVLDPAHADDLPVVAGVPAPAAAPAAPAFKATDDGNQVEYGGHKYIREEALVNERQTRQQYQQTLDQLRPLMPEFEQFLSQKQQGRQATVNRVSQGEDLGLTDDDLEGFAIARGYYDSNNKPDKARAVADLNVMSKIADRSASKYVQPVANATIEDRANNNLREALTSQFIDGDPIADQKYIRAAFDALEPAQRADPGVANLTRVIAAGLQHLDERRTGVSTRQRARREPAFREGGSSRMGGGDDGMIDALSRASARARGKSVEDWAKLTKAVAGGPERGRDLTGSVLEDV